MLNILDRKLMDWIGRNRVTFLLVILLSGNVYQYLDNRKRDDQHASDVRTLNQEIKELNEKALEHEKERTQRMEFLLNNLPKNGSNNDRTSDEKKSNAN